MNDLEKNSINGKPTKNANKNNPEKCLIWGILEYNYWPRHTNVSLSENVLYIQ